MPLLTQVDAEDSSSDAAGSEAGDLDAMPGDDATIEGSAEGSSDATLGEAAPLQDALPEASDAAIDAATDATSDEGTGAVTEAAADTQDEAQGSDGGADASPCTPGAVVCGPDGYQVQCLSDGGWAPYTQGCFCGYLCDADGGVTCGGIAATCAVNATQCSGNSVGSCDPYGPGFCGVWRVSSPCVNQACVNGVCTGVCSPGSTQCSSSGVQACTSSGVWGVAIPCGSGICDGGTCSGLADAATD